MTIIDPLSILRQMPPGSALYSREIISDRWEVAWMIREETSRIKNLGNNPEVEFRAGLLSQDRVFLIPVLVRIGPGAYKNIYEIWLNVYQTGNGSKYLDDLSKQDRVVIHLYGDRCKLERSLKVSNQIQSFIQEVISQVKDAPPWSMSAFDAAREKLYQRYPDVLSLWSMLS